jgi:hypothetical protein
MLQNAQLAAMAPFFPQFVSPQGELNLDLEMQPGPKFNGTLQVNYARTHSIAALGPIRDIALSLKLHENHITLGVLRAPTLEGRLSRRMERRIWKG